MAFFRASFRPPAPSRVRAAVFAVGRRVQIRSRAPSARVTLTDTTGEPLATLSDSTEVTILAWRPNWAGTTRYYVRVMDSGLEGWLPVGDLRGTKTAISSPPAESPRSVAHPALRGRSSGSSGRRVGQRLS